MTVIELLQTSPAAFAIAASVLGLTIGSFLNVLILRLPKMMEQEWHDQCADLRGEAAPPGQKRISLAFPPSTCPACGHRIRAWENIPVLSYLWLRGRCSACGTRISLRYPLVEILTGLLSGFTAWHFGFGPSALLALVFVWALIALTFIDLDTQLLPDSLTQPLIWLGLLVNLGANFTPLASAVIGAAAGYAALWAVYWLFKLATGKEGMGYGDFKLLAAIGAWFGWQLLPVTILLSSIVGAAAGLSLILFAGHKRQIPIPFGPYLAGGGLITLFWGHAITRAYLGL